MSLNITKKGLKFGDDDDETINPQTYGSTSTSITILDFNADRSKTNF